MIKKKETRLGMFDADNVIKLGCLVSYNLVDKINKARFEPLKSNLWIVRKIKKINNKVHISVRHFDNTEIVINDYIEQFKKENLK